MLKLNRVPALFSELFFAALVPYYQCDVNCILEFRSHIDLPRMTNAFLAALAKEPMWAHRFVSAFWRPYWELIPRSERNSLVEIVTGEEPSSVVERILRGSINTAARLYIIRGVARDTLFFQLDHRLTDATGARLLVESVRDHYAACDAVPAVDAPIVRHSIYQLPRTFSAEQRRKALTLFREQNQAIKRAPVPCYVPTITAEDPVDLAPVLDFPEGFLDQLRGRAILDYGTPALAILAAAYLGLRELVGIAPQAPLRLCMLVDLRRYLPPSLLPAPASIFIGGVGLKVEEPGANTMAIVMQQLWKELAKHRGPHFGLIPAKFLLEFPLVRFALEWMPFALLQRAVHRGYKKPNAPVVYISDLCELGRPGDVWGETELEYAHFGLGTWGIPGDINLFSGSCGSRFRIIVGTAPRSFAKKLAAAIHNHLCNYVNNPGNDPSGLAEDSRHSSRESSPC